MTGQDFAPPPAQGRRPADRLNLALIYGSTREGRFCDTIAAWAAGEIARTGGFSIDRIDPRDLGGTMVHRHEEGAALAGLRRRIGLADAFVVVTPEYNHGYPAALKFLIDSVHAEWQAKPVAFVSYGGVSGGLRAVEQLRLVFAELQAVTIRDTVSFANPWNRFDDDGLLRDVDGPVGAMAALLASLRWWAEALKQARSRSPYGRAAA